MKQTREKGKKEWRRWDETGEREGGRGEGERRKMNRRENGEKLRDRELRKGIKRREAGTHTEFIHAKFHTSLETTGGAAIARQFVDGT